MDPTSEWNVTADTGTGTGAGNTANEAEANAADTTNANPDAADLTVDITST